MVNIGDIVVIDEVEYELIEDNVVPPSKNKKIMLQLNVIALIVFIVLLTVTLLIGIRGPFTGTFELTTILLFFVSFIVFVIVHEFLHGASFFLFGKVGFRNLKFGVIIKSGVAYCVSLVPVKVLASRLSLMIPIYVVCLPLYVYSLFAQNLIISILALLYFTGSVGDLYYMWKLRKTDKNLYMFEEAPTSKGYKIGYLLFKKS